MRHAKRRWLDRLAVVLMNTLTELEAEQVRFREHQEAWRLNNQAQAAEIERLKTELEQLNLRFLLLRPHHQTQKTHP